MSVITPNTQKVYMAPSYYKECFVLDSHRYYLTDGHALKSDYGRYGMCPPIGRGFYNKISIKEYKEAYSLYIEKRSNYLKALNSGYLNAGGQQSFSL